jgi:hypothetical protein
MEEDEKIIEKLEKAIPSANDWFGHHNIFSRLIMLVFMGVFIYAFVAPLPFVYAEIAAWLLFCVFMLISIGINSLKIVANLITKIKGK